MPVTPPCLSAHTYFFFHVRVPLARSRDERGHGCGRAPKGAGVGVIDVEPDAVRAVRFVGTAGRTRERGQASEALTDELDGRTWAPGVTKDLSGRAQGMADDWRDGREPKTESQSLRPVGD